MRECRKYWLMAVSSFLSTLFRCWMTVLSPFMMFLVLRLALFQARILTKRERGRDSDESCRRAFRPDISTESGLKPLLQRASYLSRREPVPAASVPPAREPCWQGRVRSGR